MQSTVKLIQYWVRSVVSAIAVAGVYLLVKKAPAVVLPRPTVDDGGVLAALEEAMWEGAGL